MEKKYIDADALIKKLFPYKGIDKASYVINAKAVHEAIKNAPTADVAEVRHGYWVHKMTDYYPYSECSLCGYTLAGDLGNYCKNCGAKMDAERKEQ